MNTTKEQSCTCSKSPNQQESNGHTRYCEAGCDTTQEWREEFDKEIGYCTRSECVDRDKIKDFIQTLLNTYTAHLVERIEKVKRNQGGTPNIVTSKEDDIYNSALDQAIIILRK